MSCKKYREWASEAAAGTLGAERSRKLDEHAYACAGCREFLAREIELFAAVKHALRANVAIEPSREFLQRARLRFLRAQREISRVHAAGLTAAAGVAALVLIAGLWAWQAKRNSLATSAQRIFATRSAPTVQAGNGAKLPSNSAKPRPAGTNPNFAAYSEGRQERKVFDEGIATRSSEGTAAAPKTLASSTALSAEDRPLCRGNHPAAQPEILVPPGQAEALMQFVRALEKRQIDGSKLLASINSEDQPLEIKPLMILPLDSSAADDSARMESR